MNLLSGADAVLGFLVACSVKATVLLTVAWALMIPLREQSASVRHRVWAAGILSSLALPVLTLLLPGWHSAALGGAAVFWGPAHRTGTMSVLEDLPAMIVNASATSPLFSRLVGVLLLIWLTGFLLSVLRLASGLSRLGRRSAGAMLELRDEWQFLVVELSKMLKIRRPVRLLRSHNPVAMPLTWGIFRPLVILPASATEWQEERRRMVLLHELAHVARHDWCFQMCAELARSFYWFHPLAWSAAARLRQESERACDDAVLNCGIGASEYAIQLLDLARTLENREASWSVAVAIARPSSLERRFIAMLNPSINRSQIPGRARLLATCAALCLLVPLAALRLPGQNSSASLGGVIHDPSGSGVKNATVILTNQKSNTTVMTASDAEGHYGFKSLAGGAYELQVVKQGFETYRASQVALEDGRELTQNITLQLAMVTEEVDVVPEGSAKDAPESASGGKPPRVRVGGSVQATQVITKVMPVYPEGAKAAGIQGKVILHAVIGTDGKPLSLRVVNNQVDPELARSAIEAVSQWRYRPTLLNGEAVEVDTTIMVNYSLQP